MDKKSVECFDTCHFIECFFKFNSLRFVLRWHPICYLVRMIIFILLLSFFEAQSIPLKIYDARSVPPLPGVINFNRGRLVFDSQASDEAVIPSKALSLKENLEKTSTYYQEHFSLSSFDGKGGTVFQATI